MLDAVIKAKVAAAHSMVITTLGTPIDYKPAKGGATVRVTAGIKTVSPSDTELVNSYGVGTKIITIKSADVSAAPEKFDQVVIPGTNERLTVSSVVEVHLNGDLIAYKLVITGK